MPGLKVNAVDTTGAGDIFHGAFTYGIANGFDMNSDERHKKGLNQSSNHVDFMIGTNDLNIIAKTKNKDKQIFKDGKFNI